MHILQHDPKPSFGCIFNSLLSLFGSFIASNSNGGKFGSKLFASAFYFEAGIETWSATQENWLFGLDRGDYFLDIKRLIVYCLIPKDMSQEGMSHNRESIRSEDLDQNAVCYFLFDGGELNVQLRNRIFGGRRVDEADPFLLFAVESVSEVGKEIIVR